MDIREKIGQRLVFGFPGTTIPAEVAALVREYKIGNVILFRYNIESLPQLARLCADIQELVRGATGRDAFITIDQEGGMVTRLPWDAVNVPGSMALAATGKPENAVLAAEITARQLRGVGVNFNLAPDLDVNSNPMNPVIGVRSFGDDPQSVALFGTKAVEGYKNGGMLCCGKHFPGHGDTAVDSHIGLPCIEKTMDELEACELISFRAAIKAGADIVVGTHPHIVQGIEAYQDSYILYSLGNLVFGGNVDPDDRDAYLARVTFTVYEDHCDAPELTVVPIRLTALDKGTDYRPVVADEADSARIFKRIMKLSSGMGDFVNGELTAY